MMTRTTSLKRAPGRRLAVKVDFLALETTKKKTVRVRTLLVTWKTRRISMRMKSLMWLNRFLSRLPSKSSSRKGVPFVKSS